MCIPIKADFGFAQSALNLLSAGVSLVIGAGVSASLIKIFHANYYSTPEERKKGSYQFWVGAISLGACITGAIASKKIAQHLPFHTFTDEKALKLLPFCFIPPYVGFGGILGYFGRIALRVAGIYGAIIGLMALPPPEKRNGSSFF